MLDWRDDAFGKDLRMIEHVFDSLRSGTRHLVAEVGLPLARSPRQQRFAQLRHDLRRMLRALAYGVVARTRAVLDEPGLLAQCAPEVRRVRGKIEIALTRWMQARDAA